MARAPRDRDDDSRGEVTMSATDRSGNTHTMRVTDKGADGVSEFRSEDGSVYQSAGDQIFIDERD